MAPRPSAARGGIRAAPPSSDAVPGTPAPAILDETQVQALRTVADRDPKNAVARAQLGNLYYDAGRYPDAIKWYGESLALNPKDASVSTDLGVSYYYNNQPDLAIKQLEHSLQVDPKHTKALLNLGVVRAFGKQDLKGATDVWRRLVEIAPDSPEGRKARAGAREPVVGPRERAMRGPATHEQSRRRLSRRHRRSRPPHVRARLRRVERRQHQHQARRRHHPDDAEERVEGIHDARHDGRRRSRREENPRHARRIVRAADASRGVQATAPMCGRSCTRIRRSPPALPSRASRWIAPCSPKW